MNEASRANTIRAELPGYGAEEAMGVAKKQQHQAVNTNGRDAQAINTGVQADLAATITTGTRTREAVEASAKETDYLHRVAARLP